MSLTEQLANSVLNPGINPALLFILHTSFIALLLVTLLLVFFSGMPIHFILLFLIAIIAYFSILWLINLTKNID